MTFNKLWVIAYRDLGRNRRRSFFTLLAVALGLGLLIVLNGYIAGVIDNGLKDNIRLETGHLQLRADAYQAEKVSLQWDELLSDPETLAARASALGEVQAAAPVLWTTGILNTADDSASLRLYGIQTASSIYAPFRDAVVSGVFLEADDRSGIVIGKRLADNLGIGVDDKVSLAVVNADGQPDEAIFTVRGLFSTGIPTYDQNTVFLPLAKAQAFTRTEGHASAVVVMLHNADDANRVAAALQSPGITVLTWRDLNAVMLETMQTAQSIYAILDVIVMLVVAVIIANTLLMAVFERVREMGILAALGMKRRQIMSMFLIEATILAIAGIVFGIALGSLGVAYLATTGLYIGDMGAAVENIALGTTLYAKFDPPSMIWLSILTLIITLLAALYPAWFAGRMEPVEALHAL